MIEKLKEHNEFLIKETQRIINQKKTPEEIDQELFINGIKMEELQNVVKGLN